MKNLKLGIFSLLAIFAVSVFLTSCEQNELPLPTDDIQKSEIPASAQYLIEEDREITFNKNINEITADQLKTSQQLWNEKFSENITLLNYEYVGTIENEQDKQDVLKKITDETKIVAIGDINKPKSVKIEVLKENSAKANITKANLRKYIKDGIEISNKIIALNWDKNGEQFTTYCIANKEGIVWDNILGGVTAVDSETKEETENSTNSSKAGDRYYTWSRTEWRIKSFWGSTVGRFGYKITIYHNGSRVSSTVTEDWAHLKLGKHASKSWPSIHNGRRYGKVQYALAIGTLHASIVNYNRTAVANGFYHKVRNGTKTLYPQLP